MIIIWPYIREMILTDNMCQKEEEDLLTLKIASMHRYDDSNTT